MYQSHSSLSMGMADAYVMGTPSIMGLGKVKNLHSHVHFGSYGFRSIIRKLVLVVGYKEGWSDLHKAHARSYNIPCVQVQSLHYMYFSLIRSFPGFRSSPFLHLFFFGTDKGHQPKKNKNLNYNFTRLGGTSLISIKNHFCIFISMN